MIRRAHVAHRRTLFAELGWPTEALAQLCDGQHVLQERHITDHHPAAGRWVIVAEGRAVGRLCVDQAYRPWRIVDIALLPDAQGRGLGGEALRRLLQEARAAGVSVDLHVGHDNPRAQALYRRLGFTDAIGTSATHHRLCWSPSA
nr:GNAT family N-acetyltransferase [uncultured Sphingomonas sp.]